MVCAQSLLGCADCSTINYLLELITFFQSNEISLNGSKTEFIVFSKTKRTTNTHMVVDKKLIDEKEAIKYFHNDKLLTFQEETK